MNTVSYKSDAGTATLSSRVNLFSNSSVAQKPFHTTVSLAQERFQYEDTQVRLKEVKTVVDRSSHGISDIFSSTYHWYFSYDS